MMMDKFTDKARGALSAASEAAFLKNHVEVTPWHLLKALIEQSDGVVPALLDGIGISVDRVAELVDRQMQSLATQEGAAETYMSAELKTVIKGAFGECTACHSRKPGSKDLTPYGQRLSWLARDMQELRTSVLTQPPEGLPGPGELPTE